MKHDHDNDGLPASENDKENNKIPAKELNSIAFYIFQRDLYKNQPELFPITIQAMYQLYKDQQKLD